MAIDFSPLQQIDPVGGFFRGQEAARAEQERNMLLQQRQMQFEQEQENRLLSRQKMQADLATARQRQQSLAAAAKSFQQFGRDLNPQTLEEGIARAIESGDDKALDFLSKVRTEFRQSLVDRQVFGDLLDSAAPTPSVGAPAGAAPAAAMPSAAPVVAPAAAAPSLPSPEEKYLQNVSQALTERGFPPPKGVPIPALRSTTAQTLPVGEFAGVPVAASVPEGFAEAMVPTNYLAPQPAAPANAMLAPPAAPAVQVAGPAALPPAAPKTFEYGGRTYTPQQVNLLLRDERAGRRELGERIVAANKPTREGMSPLGRLYAEQAALPPGDPRQQVYAAAIEKESERPDKGTQLAQYLRERQAIAQANPADPRLAIYDDVIKKMREKPEGTTVNVGVSTERKYGEQFGGLVAKTDEALLRAAQDAPAQAENANRILSTLATGKAITGPLADVKLSIARALNVVGADNADTISKTESLVTSMAENTLNAIKTSGLGTGQGFTNKDLEFLEKAKSGNINFQPDTIRQLAELAHRAAEKTAEKWSTRVKQIPKSALEGTGVSTEPIAVPKRASSVTAGARPSGVDTDWTLMQDANGKKAWVSPDRKQVKEVD